MMYFIGFTGASTNEELIEIHSLTKDQNLPESFRVNAGILFNDKTIYNTPSRRMYPEKDIAYELLNICNSYGWTPVIHFSTSHPLPLSEQIEDIFDYNSIYQKGICRTVQLNISWPDIDEIKKITSKYDELSIILQINMWDKLDKESWLKIDDYLPYISYLLFDASGGRGKYNAPYAFMFKVNQIIQYFNLDPEKIVLAGGLSSKNIASFYHLASDTLGLKYLSFDAQGGLRGRSFKGRKVGDKLNPQKVHDYISAIGSLFL
jgi:hypothetical protein